MMKRSLTLPFALCLAALSPWGGHAFTLHDETTPDGPPASQEQPVAPTPAPPLDADGPRRAIPSRIEHPPQLTLIREDDGKKQTVTFLGVSTSPLPEAVAAQLPVEKGTGLLVTFVVKDSPAAKAGLEPNDVLVKLDEHILVNPAQLQTVIENRAEGSPAALVFYRRGQEKTVSATLASQEKSASRHGGGGGDWSDPARTAEFQAALVRAQDAAEMGRRAADLGRQQAEIGKRAAEFGRQAAARGKEEAEHARREAEEERGAAGKEHHDWARSMASLQEALKGIDRPHDGFSTSFVNPGSAQAITVDGEGTVLLTRQGGRMHLRATDKSGKVLFDGDVATPQGQPKLPPELAAKVEKLLQEFPAAPPLPPMGPIPPAPPVPAAPMAPPAPPALAAPAMP